MKMLLYFFLLLLLSREGYFINSMEVTMEICYHGGMIDHNTRRVLFLFLIIVFLFWLLFQAGHKQ
jgi:hypothetical protein